MPRIHHVKPPALVLGPAANPPKLVRLRSTPRSRGDDGPPLPSPKDLKGVMTYIDPRRAIERTRYGRSLTMDRIDTSLRNADYGSMMQLTDLSRETIDTDPHLAAVLGKRFGAVSALPWDVVPADGYGIDQGRARFYAEVVRDQLKQLPNLSQSINQLAWGIFDGRSVLENDWMFVAETPGMPTIHHERFGTVRWMIRNLEWIHPRRLQFGPKRELRISDHIFGYFSLSGLAIDDWPCKFLQFKPQMFGDYQEREGLSRRCLYWSFFKRVSARERMVLMELFGKPWRWLEVEEDSTADGDDLNDADEQLQQLGGQASFRFPRGTKFHVEQPAKGAGDVHQTVIEESDKQLSKLVLGQTGTTDANPAGLNNAQANVMQDEQFMILLRDARLISEAIETGLTDPIIELNFGPESLTYAPHFVLRADVPLDRLKELQRLDAAIKVGLEVSAAEAYEISGFSPPKETDAVLKLDTPPVHPMAVQAPAERPIIAYPASTVLPVRTVQPIAVPAKGGLQSPAGGQVGAIVDPLAPKPPGTATTEDAVVSPFDPLTDPYKEPAPDENAPLVPDPGPVRKGDIDSGPINRPTREAQTNPDWSQMQDWGTPLIPNSTEKKSGEVPYVYFPKIPARFPKGLNSRGALVAMVHAAVPVVDQTPNMCGPAALKAVLEHFGVEVEAAVLADEMGATEAGATPGMLAATARKHGLEASVEVDATWDRVQALLDGGVPPIVDWWSTTDGHYSVVTDLNATEVQLMDPEKAEKLWVNRDEFFQVWFDFGADDPDHKEPLNRCLVAINKPVGATPETSKGGVSGAKGGSPTTLPFGGFKNFADCISKMLEQGNDEESARAICGALQHKGEADAARGTPGGTGALVGRNVAAALKRAHPKDARAMLTVYAYELGFNGGCACGCDGVHLAAPLAGQHLPEEVRSAKQPVSHKQVGSIETLIGRGVRTGSRASTAMTQTFVEAVKGVKTARDINDALVKAARGQNLHPFQRSMERNLIMGAMTGAVDAHIDFTTGRPGKPVAFEGEDPAEFVSKPFGEAVSWFKAKDAVPRSTFDLLDAAAKRKAFTIVDIMNQRQLDLAQELLTAQLQEGLNLADFAEQLDTAYTEAGFTLLNPSHIENVYRTNVCSAYGEGRYEQMTQPEVLDINGYWQVRTVNDGPPRQRPTHAALDGWIFRADDEVWATIYPPFGWNCFLPDTVVAGEFEGASRALYRGEAVELFTAEGRRLSVTANHPVLTTEGFVNAGDLRVGCKLIGYGSKPGVPLLGASAQHNEHHVQATAEQVFRAMAESGLSALAQPAPNDFHGEAERFVGEVNVVGTYCNLGFQHQPTVCTELSQLNLEPPDVLSLGSSDALTGGSAAVATPLGVPSGGALANPGLPVHGVPLQTFGVGLAPQLDPVYAQQALDSAAGAPELLRQLEERNPGLVVTDELVNVRHFDWEGHVYDFSAASGLVVAGGIVASNCRCRVVSLSTRSVKEGEMTVHSGSEVSGIPDPGFTAGVGGGL